MYKKSLQAQVKSSTAGSSLGVTRQHAKE